MLPELTRRARERGVELVEVDLRWGVPQEQTEDGHDLEICLQEIERCRPFFIGMLRDNLLLKAMLGCQQAFIPICSRNHTCSTNQQSHTLLLLISLQGR